MTNPSPNPSLRDQRTRVTFFLPCNVHAPTSLPVFGEDPTNLNASLEERKHLRILNGIVRYITSLQRDINNNIQGFTISNYPKTGYSGYWYNSNDELLPSGKTLSKGWWIDNIVQMIVDYHYPYGSQELHQAITSLYNSVSTIYRSNNCYEVDYWVVAQPVNRFA